MNSIQLIVALSPCFFIAGCGKTTKTENSDPAIIVNPAVQGSAAQLVEKAIENWSASGDWDGSDVSKLDIHDFGVVGSNTPNRKRLILISYVWKTKSRVPNFRGSRRLIVFDQRENYIGFSSIHGAMNLQQSRSDGTRLLLVSEDGDEVSIQTDQQAILAVPVSSFVGPMHSHIR